MVKEFTFDQTSQVVGCRLCHWRKRGVHEKCLKHTIARAENHGKNESKVETQELVKNSLNNPIIKYFAIDF